MDTIDAVGLARRLIGFHSVSNVSSREIADFISNLLDTSGFSVEQQSYRLSDGVEKVNVVATKGGKDMAKLALSGHIDTVPFDEKEWRNHDPLNLELRDGRFYGRGACDMKGFLAVAMVAGMRIPAHELSAPFSLVFTSDEEVGCIGARKLVEAKGKLADMFVIGEPTSFQPFILHKGYIFVRINLRGKGGHSSEPAKGRNVLERALPQVIVRLNEFKSSLERIRDERLSPSYPTLNIGKLSTGRNSAKNTIAEECTLELDIRPIPGQDVDEVFEALRRHVAPEGEINGIAVDIKLVRKPTLPFETSKDAGIVRETVAMTGKPATSTSFNTEGGVFNHAGSESVICGLGSIAQAHQPDEFVDAHFLSEDFVRRYEQLIRRVCGKS